MKMKSLSITALLGLAVLASNSSFAADPNASESVLRTDTNFDSYIVSAEADKTTKERIPVWTPPY